MRKPLFTLALLIGFLTAFHQLDAAKVLSPGNHDRSYTFGDRTRTYRIHLPAGALSKGPVPLVLAFHGGGTTAQSMERTTGLNALADLKGFVVVYPNGTGITKTLLTWNAGACCAYATRKKVDDVGAVGALLDDLARVIPYDTNRVYATGMSNGAMMVYRLACEMSDRIAAIAPVAGTMITSRCAPKRPVPVMHFHGTADQNVQYTGGVGPYSITKVAFQSVDDTINKWRAINGCSDKAVKVRLADRDQGQTHVDRKVWNSCRQHSEVVLYTVTNGGHTWPGNPIRKWGKFGLVTQDVNANEAMWDFFSRHPLR